MELVSEGDQIMTITLQAAKARYSVAPGAFDTLWCPASAKEGWRL